MSPSGKAPGFGPGISPGFGPGISEVRVLPSQNFGFLTGVIFYGRREPLHIYREKDY